MDNFKWYHAVMLLLLWLITRPWVYGERAWRWVRRRWSTRL